LKKQQCIRRSATCWAQRVNTQVDWPSGNDLQKMFYSVRFRNYISCILRAVLTEKVNLIIEMTMILKFISQFCVWIIINHLQVKSD
jgi:hypothetical protein